MALTTGTAMALMAASAAASAYNTNRTAKKQDGQAAAGIRQSASRQRQAEAKVNDSVKELETSRSGDEASERMGSYMDALRRGKGATEAGMNQNIGSEAFRAGSADAAGQVNADAGRVAGLMSRMDAPGIQRQGEAFGYGNLATEVGLIGKESQSDEWINRLRMNSIKRNPWIDAAASGMNMAAQAGAGSGGGGGGSWAQPAAAGGAGVSPISGVTVRGGGTGWQGNSAFGKYGQGWGG